MKGIYRTALVLACVLLAVSFVAGCKKSSVAVEAQPVQCKCTECGADFGPEAKVNLTKPGLPEGAIEGSRPAYKCPKCGKFAVRPATKCTKCSKWFVEEHQEAAEPTEGPVVCPGCGG